MLFINEFIAFEEWGYVYTNVGKFLRRLREGSKNEGLEFDSGS